MGRQLQLICYLIYLIARFHHTHLHSSGPYIGRLKLEHLTARGGGHKEYVVYMYM